MSLLPLILSRRVAITNHLNICGLRIWQLPVEWWSCNPRKFDNVSWCNQLLSPQTSLDALKCPCRSFNCADMCRLPPEETIWLAAHSRHFSLLELSFQEHLELALMSHQNNRNRICEHFVAPLLARTLRSPVKLDVYWSRSNYSVHWLFACFIRRFLGK